jgi:hypothetical protein
MDGVTVRRIVLDHIAQHGELAWSIMGREERREANRLVRLGHLTRGHGHGGRAAFFRGAAPTWYEDALQA